MIDPLDYNNDEDEDEDEERNDGDNNDDDDNEEEDENEKERREFREFLESCESGKSYGNIFRHQRKNRRAFSWDETVRRLS